MGPRISQQLWRKSRCVSPPSDTTAAWHCFVCNWLVGTLCVDSTDPFSSLVNLNRLDGVSSLTGLATGKLVSKFKRELDYCTVLYGTGKRLTMASHSSDSRCRRDPRPRTRRRVAFERRALSCCCIIKRADSVSGPPQLPHGRRCDPDGGPSTICISDIYSFLDLKVKRMI